MSNVVERQMRRARWLRDQRRRRQAPIFQQARERRFDVDLGGADFTSSAALSVLPGWHGQPLVPHLFMDRTGHGPRVRLSVATDTPDGSYEPPTLFDAGIRTRRVTIGVTIDTRHFHGCSSHRIQLKEYCERTMFRAGTDGHLWRALTFKPYGATPELPEHRLPDVVSVAWRGVGYEIGPVLGKVHVHFVWAVEYFGMLDLGATQRHLKALINADRSRKPVADYTSKEWGVFLTLYDARSQRNHNYLAKHPATKRR